VTHLVALVGPSDEEEAFTEEQGHRLVQPPAKQHDKWHPEEQELDAQVDRTRFSEDVRIRRRTEEVAQAGPDEEPDREHCIRREGHDGKEDDAEPSTRKD